MPLSKTVVGLKDEWHHEDYATDGGGAGWTVDSGGAALTAANDDTTKIEGACSTRTRVLGVGTYYHVCGAITTNRAVNMSAGDVLRIWHKCDISHDMYGPPYLGWKLDIKNQDAIWVTLIDQPWSEDWTLRQVTIPDVLGGADHTDQLRHIIWIEQLYWQHVYDWFDHMVICKSQYVTIDGFTQAQKVELYRASDNTLLDTKTLGVGETEVVFDIYAQEFPLYLYLKVYASDGVTLVEQTANKLICGGDEYLYSAPTGNLTIESDAFVIIEQSGSGTPKTANITATLLTDLLAPYPGKTVYFTTSRGTITASDVTDANGEAHATLTSTTHGIAIAKAIWGGDADAGAATKRIQIHVFHTAEVGDPSKRFQFYVEGVEYPICSGRYVTSNSSEIQDFEVEIPQWEATITRRGLVSIYRVGVLDFSGVLTKVRRSIGGGSTVTLAGQDSRILLEAKVVILEDYVAQTLSYILTDLFTKYVCGITVGTIGSYPDTLTITFTNNSLADVIKRLSADVTIWLTRINADRTLDMAASFGVTKSVEFIEGQNLLSAEHTEDTRNMSNWVRAMGSPNTLISIASDPASLDEYGELEEPIFQKYVTNQATLDLTSQAALTEKVGVTQQVHVEAIDDYDVGTWGVDDYVTITCDDVELSGTYKVVRLTRDMMDPGYAEIECTNKATLDLADLFDKMKRQLKDLNVI